jgi:uncharacterized protein (TIGR03435 family)
MRMRRKYHSTVLVLLTACWLIAHTSATLIGGVRSSMAVTQTPAERLVFDVASIKHSPPILERALRPFVGIPQPGVWRVRDMPVVSALRNAYPGYPLAAQIIGAPEWLSSVRDLYDIEARTTATATAEEVRQMARALLADRFKLALHTERRELPVIVLTQRNDRKLGSGLKPPSVDCTAFRAGGPRPTDPALKPNADRLPCVVARLPTFEHTLLVPGADTRLTAGDVPIADVVTMLENFFDRPVIDRTGLTQRFDIELQFSADPLRATGDGGPSIRTAITEQLGLQVQEDRAAIDVLVIDHIERPSEN